MTEIKSALELALEKAERYGKASREEMAAAQFQERGRHLAVQYLKGEGDLAAELRNIPADAAAAARTAIKEVFLRNISLPRNEEADPRMDQAVAGLLLAAANPQAMARLKAELEHLRQNFLQIRNNALQQLKARYAGGITQMQRAMEAQMRRNVHVEVEQIPQFQEEWRGFQGKLLEQFEPMLEDLKTKMLRA